MPKSVCVPPMKGKKTKILLDPHGFKMHSKEKTTVLDEDQGTNNMSEKLNSVSKVGLHMHPNI